MDASPFPHQGPLEPAQVLGRAALVADLTERITSRRVTALLGPRRFGKTSVMRRVAADLADGGASVVWVDLYEVTSVADVARRFDVALAESRGPVRSALESLAPRLNLSLGLLGVELSRRAAERPDADAALDSLLEALVTTARGTPTVVVIDEFPGLDRIDGAAGLLRTKLQHHVQEIGLLFAGSQPSLMRTMFTDSTRPFYAQADLVAIGPFDFGAVHQIVSGGFRDTGRDPGDLPEQIYRFAEGHPYRTMQVADVAWRGTPPGERSTASLWRDSLDTLRAETGLATEGAFSGFPAAEKSVLRLLAHGQPLFGSAAELLGLSASSAQHARDRLADRGEVGISEGMPSLIDPVLADWVRRRFPS